MVSCFFCPRTLKGDDKVANPHFEIKITKRSKRQSAVAGSLGAALSSGHGVDNKQMAQKITSNGPKGPKLI